MATLTIGTNSYIDLDYANNYFSERLFTDIWDNSDDVTKIKAILMATRKIERQPIRGRKSNIDQTMQFPRLLYSYERRYFGVNPTSAPEYAWNYGPGWYAEIGINPKVQDAVCEEALALLTYGTSKRVELQKQGVKSFNIGGMSETLSGSEIKLMSQEARELLKGYISGGVEIL